MQETPVLQAVLIITAIQEIRAVREMAAQEIIQETAQIPVTIAAIRETVEITETMETAEMPEITVVPVIILIQEIQAIIHRIHQIQVIPVEQEVMIFHRFFPETDLNRLCPTYMYVMITVHTAER